MTPEADSDGWKEARWLADPPDLGMMCSRIQSLHDRKQRLAVMAVLRMLATRFPGQKIERLLTAYEEMADHREHERLLTELGGLNPFGDLDHDDWKFCWAVRTGIRGFENGGVCRINEIQLQPDDRRGAGALMLCIFGNPFRPVAFEAAWRTAAAVQLARQMYESRDFGNMPILADALQDAGCDNDDVLAHCRDPNATHVRGCWVVDLVLGKE